MARYVNLAVADEAVVVFPGRPFARAIATDRCAEREIVEFEMLIRHRFRVIGQKRWSAVALPEGRTANTDNTATEMRTFGRAVIACSVLC